MGGSRDLSNWELTESVVGEGLCGGWGSRSSGLDMISLRCLLEHPNGNSLILASFLYQLSKFLSDLTRKRKGIHFEMKLNQITSPFNLSLLKGMSSISSNYP